MNSFPACETCLRGTWQGGCWVGLRAGKHSKTPELHQCAGRGSQAAGSLEGGPAEGVAAGTARSSRVARFPRLPGTAEPMCPPPSCIHPWAPSHWGLGHRLPRSALPRGPGCGKREERATREMFLPKESPAREFVKGVPLGCKLIISRKEKWEESPFCPHLP